MANERERNINSIEIYVLKASSMEALNENTGNVQ
jgi:hypothetical protein